MSKNSVKDSIELLEYFVDSLSIGRPKQNKIELVFLRSIDSSYVVINFYKRTQKDSWTLKQKFNFLKEDLMGCFTELADFNNDGFNDVTYKSLVAARGANDVRNLFIYDGITDQLIYMKNSEDYPNMLYNKKLNCIDAFLVHGGSTTVFLKIEKDSLKEFASVNLDDKINIRLVDKNGKRKYLVKDKKSDFDPHTRFTNFSPLE
ncbi:hypothetical protein LPB86_17535 [Pedobacter sp. MC2016-14]|uniref:hypothetical protein n=1 Tax=Pedobacter sp. MC2016-14 TaxID=2897327 RepID=UPI001E4BF5E3|nr:hypothetical protein [Pedobacter sp. MC2016-14]MCD0490047.1 hypothetical protein [Pedobacter sp. MC2016-14]